MTAGLLQELLYNNPQIERLLLRVMILLSGLDLAVCLCLLLFWELPDDDVPSPTLSIGPLGLVRYGTYCCSREEHRTLWFHA